MSAEDERLERQYQPMQHIRPTCVRAAGGDPSAAPASVAMNARRRMPTAQPAPEVV
jgi:hypothetical protein